MAWRTTRVQKLISSLLMFRFMLIEETNHLSIDPYEYLQIIPNPDGTITRKPSIIPDVPTTPDPDNPTPVLSKDIPINQERNTWARIFLPKQALDASLSDKKSFPIVVYLHGGGFITSIGVASTVYHGFCSNLASQVQAIVISVEYRLAPEHRLPAAYDDVIEAIQVIKNSDEVWFKEHADYSSCYVMGNSAGGNLAYHAGLRLAHDDDFEPLKIKGLILHSPAFSGAIRTKSESLSIDDPVIPLAVNDLLWHYALPVGADRDHEFCNPMVGGGSKLLDKMKLMEWRVMVIGWKGDPMFERQVELTKLMEEKGIEVDVRFGEGGYHNVDLNEASKGEELIVAVREFIKESFNERFYKDYSMK